jgi:hypothetical protein
MSLDCTGCESSYILQPVSSKIVCLSRVSANCLSSSYNYCIECNIGFYLTKATGNYTLCVICNIACKTCKNGISCTSCSSGKFLDSSNNNTCLPCSENCQICNNSNICTSCSNLYVLQ